MEGDAPVKFRPRDVLATLVRGGPPKKPHRVVLTDRQLATVLSALRHWQSNRNDLIRVTPGHFDEHRPLTDLEVDRLCERLNCGK